MPINLSRRSLAPLMSFRLSQMGFTLIELLLVVVLLGVVAGLAIPNFGNTFANFQLNETAKNISALMQYAQSRSAIKGTVHAVEFDATFSKYWLTQQVSPSQESDSQENFERIPGKFGRMFAIPQGITVESEIPKVFIYPDGKIDQVRIYLHNQKNDYVTVTTREQAGYAQVFEFKIE